MKIKVLVLLGLALTIGHAVTAFGQTADQLRQLQQLTPAQRAAVLEALGESDEFEQDALSEPVLVTPRSAEVESADEVWPTERSNAESHESGAMPSRDELQPFGYDLFAGQPTTFAPATDIPVPVDYVIGPGDTVELQLFGNQNANYSLVVGRDGILNVPEIGPVSVSGLKFGALVKLLEQRVSEQMIGVNTSITMGPLRSIRVFVLGEAFRPGSYTVSALSTMTNALFVSGGVKGIGSLRNIQLKRNGKTITTLDLYDLLLRGDTSDDQRLQPGDVIFIPPAGVNVAVGGEVRRPAIYEIRNEKNVREVLEITGGMLATAYPSASQIERINSERERTIIDVDLSSATGLDERILADDFIVVYSVLDKKEDIVVLNGHAYRPGPQQWFEGMRITDLVPSISALRPKADLEYVMIRRESGVTHEVTALSTSLMAAFREPGSAADIFLEPLDEITVFDLDGDRSTLIKPVLEELRLQARHGQPAPEVRVTGRVRAPGTYPLEKAMRVSDLIRAGAYLSEAAYPVEAELTRYEIDGLQQRQTRLVVVDLASAMTGNESADLVLQPHDILNIKEIPLWRELEVISIAGEVRFPGDYPIRRGERLSSMLQRVGGLTDFAFPDGAIFMRQELKARERQQLQEMADRIEAEIETAAAADTEGSDVVEARRALLEQVRETRATGRLVIDLSAIVTRSAGADIDVVLRDGDRLLVPRASQTVTMIGEVQFPTSHVFKNGISRDEYIDMSGGLTSQADKKRVYIVRADGSVVVNRGSRFFRRRDVNDIRPGDTIVAPIKPDPVSALSFWTSVTSVIYNIGVAAAAVASF